MQLRYEDDFLEGAVFLRSRSRLQLPPRLQVSRYHRERERLYLVADPDERNDAFFRLNLEWFREWSMESILLEPLDELPLLRPALNQLVFRKARTKREEAAELYVKHEGGRTAVVAMRLDQFDRPAELTRFLRREFLHLSDMINPAFRYSPNAQVPGQNAAQQRATRERYRLLWDITIDGRLSQFSRNHSDQAARLRSDFEKVFGFWPAAKREDVFRSLWSNPDPRHGDLLVLATDPRGTKSAAQPAPGALCPLCAFATFDWAESNQLAERVVAKIRTDFPQWTLDQGACGRCAEIYNGLCASTAASL